MLKIEPVHEISNNVVCVTSKVSDQPAHMRSLIRAFAYHLNVLWLLSYWLNIIWNFYPLKEAVQARLSLHMSKCNIVGNHMSRLKFIFFLPHTEDNLVFSLLSEPWPSYICYVSPNTVTYYWQLLA